MNYAYTSCHLLRREHRGRKVWHIWMDMVIAANAQGFSGIERILYVVNPKIELLELPASLVTQEMVSAGGIDVNNLDTVAGTAYSDRSWMPTSEWMPD